MAKSAFRQALEEAIDQHRTIVGHVDRVRHVPVERATVEHDRHAASTEHVRRPDDHGIANALGHVTRLLARDGRAARRLRDAEVPEQLREPLAVFCEID